MRMWVLVDGILVDHSIRTPGDGSKIILERSPHLPTVANSRPCVRTGTGESLIKIVSRNAEKDRHIAVSEIWVTLSGRTARIPWVSPHHGSEEDHVVAKALPLLSPRMVQLFKAVDCPVGMVTADILVVKSCDVRNVCNFIGLYSAI